MQEMLVQAPGQEDTLENEMDGNPLQFSCLGNLVDRGDWQATVYGVSRVRHDLVTKQQHIHIYLNNSQNGVKANAMSLVGLDFIPEILFECLRMSILKVHIFYTWRNIPVHYHYSFVTGNIEAQEVYYLPNTT